MARGIGRALQRAVSLEGFDVDLAAEGRTLANARRRQVFRYLCLRPCARIGDMGRQLRMSQATVRWHVWNLLEHRYVDADRTRMFPAGLIDPEDAALFATLAAPGRAAVLAATFEAPGISFQDLAARVGLTRQSISKIASELTEFGLVKLLEDGRHRRVRPTDVLAQKREANRVRADAFGEALVRRLAAEGLSPELLRRDETTLLVRFGMGTQRVLLDLSLDPYGTVWQRAE
ncbi:MAG: MarR family transcriptional regulator [Methanobacteriota archaeon]|nr:MAG: MarR family transcriptional regulator [Euryarchaeota archaeon]